MKKTCTALLCILLMLFVLASCNNDTKAPEDNDNGATETPDVNGNGNSGTPEENDGNSSENPESETDVLSGTWIYEGNDSTITLTFNENGDLVYSDTNYDEDTTFRYAFEDGNIFISTENDAFTKVEYNLSEDQKTIFITSYHGNEIYNINEPFQADGTTNGIIGTWSDRSNSDLAEIYYTYTITDNQLSFSNTMNEVIIYYTLYNYTQESAGVLKLDYVEGKSLIAVYNQQDDTIKELDSGKVYIRK